VTSQQVLRAQAIYFAVTGIWPVVDLDSFQKITGPKPEGWLVKTLGALITAVGAALWVGAQRERPSRETKVLALGSAAFLGASDLWYAGPRRRISPVYLADAAAQAAIVCGLLVASDGSRSSPDTSRHPE
jgi:hypothetical protein